MAIDLRRPAMRLKLSDDETEIDLDALQGLWSVEQSLRLTNQTNRLIAFTSPRWLITAPGCAAAGGR